MAGETGFKHIHVQSDPEDDVVYQAGIVEGLAEEGGVDTDDLRADREASESPADDLEEPDANEALYVEETFSDSDEDADGETEAESAGEPDDGSRHASDVPHAPNVADQGDSYHETTLEDVESSKMGTPQKVVLLAALIAIIAFCVWYVMR